MPSRDTALEWRMRTIGCIFRSVLNRKVVLTDQLKLSWKDLDLSNILTELNCFEQRLKSQQEKLSNGIKSSNRITPETLLHKRV